MTKHRFGPPNPQSMSDPSIDAVTRRLEAARAGQPAAIDPKDISLMDRFHRPLEVGELLTVSVPLAVPAVLTAVHRHPNSPDHFIMTLTPSQIQMVIAPGPNDLLHRVGMMAPRPDAAKLPDHSGAAEAAQGEPATQTPPAPADTPAPRPPISLVTQE